MNSNSQPVALITGAAGGIGRATALELARTHAVIIIDRDQRELEKTAALIVEAGGRPAAFVADVTDLESVQRAVKAASRSWARSARP